jgi:uncharacterized protein (DUF433 family)
MTLVLDSRIVSNPKIKGGKPCIAGRRISVQDIAIWNEGIGMGVDKIAAEYDLSLTDIRAVTQSVNVEKNGFQD